MHNANKSHQNEAGSRLFNEAPGISQEHKIAKNKFKRQILIYRPCFDATRFQERERGIMYSVYSQ